MAIALAVGDSVVVPILVGPVYVAGVVALARSWGAAYAVPTAIAGVVAFDWFEIPPTHSRAFPDAANLGQLAAYLVASVLVGALAAHTAKRADVTEVARSELEREQAALRRVATLVARDVRPAEVFAAVAEEMGRLLGVEHTAIARYEADGTASFVASWGEAAVVLPVGTREPLGGDNVSSVVHRTGRPARIDDYAGATGALGDRVRDAGVRCAVGSPVVVDGRLWGVITAATRRAEPLPPGTEWRIGEFTELMATAIANTQARSELAASRARVVAAADEERRQVVRDLHDGAQQRLVQTVVTLKLAGRALDDEQDSARGLVAEALGHAERARVELGELAHGILPTVLTHGGLRASVEALASRMIVSVDNRVSVDRLAAVVEATAYFVVAEALTNVAKHAHAELVTVTAHVADATLTVAVRDDGVGGARPDGSGLLGLADRLAALDGRLRVETPPDGGTLVAAAIPLDGHADLPM